jgi:hypothetical protein
MNTEQIIKLGYEAGLCDEEGADANCIYISAHLTRFAALVAAAEIEALIPHLIDLWEENPNAVMFGDMRRYAVAIRLRK